MDLLNAVTQHTLKLFQYYNKKKQQQLKGVKEVGGCAKSQEYLLMCAITSQFSICVRWLSVDVSFIYIYIHTHKLVFYWFTF